MTAYLLNLLDLLFTLHALHHGAVELNPILQSVPVMVIYKVVIVGGLLWWLERRRARKALGICAAVYGAVVLWHLINWAAILAA